MAEHDETQPQQEESVQLRGGTYELIRNRLLAQSQDLRERLAKLNVARKAAFGAVDHKLLASERISTDNNCVPRDMVSIGDQFIFGYNVFVGLRTETTLADVFGIYQYKDGSFTPCPLDLIRNPQFEADFQNLYKYYRRTNFAKFSIIGPHLFMVFRTGPHVNDIKTFKWLIRDNHLEYLDNRSDHEFKFPPQHEFEWRRVTQDMHHEGRYPHISIEDRVFVETVGGDLTIKIEDNTATGEGIYAEPVDNPDQTLSDAEIYYACIGNVILLKIRPYEEKAFRYIVYNEKIEKARRLDAVEEACILLPENHGLIFPRGSYLLTGQYKLFDTQIDGMVFEKRITSPNGEDVMFIFFHRLSGVYVLLSYNIIEQQINTPVICNGYTLFEDGTAMVFRANGEAKKHHVIQIWQTPYYGPDFVVPVKTDTELNKIGNRDIVRCMAECTEVLNLAGQDESYANLYLDIFKRCEDILDTYFWIDGETTGKLNEPLALIRDAAHAAIEEYDKVVRTRANTRSQIDQVGTAVREAVAAISTTDLEDINAFVAHLSQLRSLRGDVVSLKDLQYADLAQIETLETEVAEHTDQLAQRCVEFLLSPEALVPYQNKISQQAAAIDGLAKVTEAKDLQVEVTDSGAELEMLTDIVSNLKIEDATQTTAIIDRISTVYAQVNQVKAALKNKLQTLGRTEGLAEFSAQLKLIDQLMINTLDLCDTPDKCDEYLSKAMVQLETLESKFADFDDFILQLTEKREELYNAFESRKVQLTSQRNQRASALMAAAERILKGIENRVKSFTDLSEINGYFAADLMIERVRDTIDKLADLGDTVKAEDIKGRLKTIHQDAVRQLKDKLALYEDGENIIRLGQHRFSVNHQDLTGTLVRQDDGFFFHLTGTGFFMPVHDDSLEETRAVWNQEVVSESPTVYRAEYLAYKLYQELKDHQELASLSDVTAEDLLARAQTFMGPRYDEGYIKGVHDVDAASILMELIQRRDRIGLLAYPTTARALACVFWTLADLTDNERSQWTARIQGMGHARDLFGHSQAVTTLIAKLQARITAFVASDDLFEASLCHDAATYLFDQLAGGTGFVIDPIASDLQAAFETHLDEAGFSERLSQCRQSLQADPLATFRLLRDWTQAYLLKSQPERVEYAEEIASLLLAETAEGRVAHNESVESELTSMVGSHPLLQDGTYRLNIGRFMTRLREHDQQCVPLFRQFQQVKNQLVQRYSDELRLDEFKPRVMTTFVRNRLIDRIYLPLIGDNLSKQIGSEGDTKRTDRQGLLLLISPPGYGKTTLMEYVANRLGLTFMKINGPAIGHGVTSLDPAEAPNAAARAELDKLNLGLEMGDNVMLYVDDIQHTNPEFLQKFISLCDAQRKIEGVYQGHSKTYDLRGKRVCVIMAGNPYTESGERFKIPDMLANRADTYNIGDIVGDNADAFGLSYLENCLTSNAVLEGLTRRSQSDAYAILKIAQTGQQEGVDLEGNYTAEELGEYVSTMKKLLVVRDVVLKVNRQYILSAGQAAAYRTEPPFLLQGSYRNMNRIAGRVLPMMNDAELWTLITSAYEQDAQTLTSGAEANLLKFRELLGRLDENQTQRWNEIKKTFQRNLLLGGDDSDNMTRLMGQLTSVSTGLDSIKDAISTSVTSLASTSSTTETNQDELKQTAEDILTRMAQLVNAVQQQNLNLASQAKSDKAAKIKHDSQMLVSVLEEQFKAMETWLMPMAHGEKKDKEHVIDELAGRFEMMVKGYEKLIAVLRSKKGIQNTERRIQKKNKKDSSSPKPNQERKNND